MTGRRSALTTREARLELAWRIALAALLILSMAPQSWAGQPQDQLKSAIDRVVSTLESPALKGEGKVAERRAAVRKIADELFDFGEIARRALGRYWQPLTEAQRTEFVALFADLLERSYISKIELYGGEKIVYTGDRVEGDLATVGTKIITKNGTEVPVDYRLFKKGDRWMVYDVNIEGISLVSNYRTQFNKIIQTNGYNSLVERMKVKQNEFLEVSGGKRKAQN
ncbi:MAG TPA: ABC transporter substrate-binding protein [Candidatus Eisenbacteria bacterium]|nr:ABC transporter substrate-binding protein [Candidatus Eisenbacteria bacterium]